MSKTIRFIFIFLLIASIYHIIRDVLQILEIHNWFSDVLSYERNWVRIFGPYFGDYYLFPWEIVTIIGSIIVLKANKIGFLGKIVILIQIVVVISWILNWTLG